MPYAVQIIRAVEATAVQLIITALGSTLTPAGRVVTVTFETRMRKGP
jgi:hypothetical protein